MGSVRPIPAPALRTRKPSPRRLPLAMPVAIIAGLIGWLAVFGWEATESPDLAPGVTSREARAAIELADRFVAAVADDRAGEAAALLDSSWVRLDLPGLPLGYIRANDRPGRLEAALAFYGSVADLDLGRCRVDPPRVHNPHRRVVCNEATVTGTFAEALRAAGVETTMIFAIDGDHIVSVLRAPVGVPRVIDYCAWAERTNPELATRLFDSSCWPSADGDRQAAEHIALAAGYVDAGLPEAENDYLVARWSGGVVDDLLAFHNAGIKSPRFFAPGQVGSLPGLFGRVHPSADQVDVLAWSSTMYRIDLGACSSATRRLRELRVACPDAVWGGPLLDALAMKPVRQPVTFRVATGSIVGLHGEDSLVLLHAFSRLCDWVHETMTAGERAAMFADGCTPVYERDAAELLLAAAVSYDAKATGG